MHSLSKQVHYFVFVAEDGVGLCQNLRYYSLNRMRIYYKGIVSMTTNVLKLTVTKEYDDRINRDAVILWQRLPDGLNMSGILHDRIIKAMLLFAICQYLCPIFLMFIAENPTTIILNFKHDNARFCCNGYIYLCVFSIRFLYV